MRLAFYSNLARSLLYMKHEGFVRLIYSTQELHVVKSLLKVQSLDVGVARTLSDILRIVRVLQFGASNANLWFRGQSNAAWPLVPKIHRRYNSKAENEMTNEFRAKAYVRHQDCSPADDHAAWMCKMQHNKLPTRLLDWSSSALVAAYFAVSNVETDEPAVIWVTSQGILNCFLTGKSPSAFFHTGHLTSGLRAVAVAAPRPDIRMTIQQGAFTLHNDKTPLEEIPNARKALHRIIIPNEWKAHIQTELHAFCGINRAYLFPDDLGELSNQIMSNSVSESYPDPDAINLFPVPPLPLDYAIHWGSPTPEASRISTYLGCSEFITTHDALIVDACERSPQRMNVTDVVQINKAEFAGFYGTISKIDASAGTAWIVLSLFDQERLVEVRLTDLVLSSIVFDA